MLGDYLYGSPGTLERERPPCWGKLYSEGDKDCKVCGFQSSCRSEIVRLNVNKPVGFAAASVQQPAPSPAPYYAAYSGQQYAPLSPYVAPPPAPAQLAPAPMYRAQPVVTQVVAPRPPAQVQQAPQQQQSIYPAPTNYGYGWLQDPLYNTIQAVPPPMRPQFPGESFIERVGKNMLLSMVESFFAQGFLAIRQLVLAPSPELVPSPSDGWKLNP